MFPFVDVDSRGSVEGMTRNVARMLEELPADVKIIPGHGPLSTVAELKEFHRMLVATTDVVRQRVKAGQDLAAIQAEGLPEEWAPWGAGFIDTKRWIEIVVRSLEKDANG
jgi:glyoxylase-like metal-dependent hydrolase (beta-lactamase superfamily II)